MYVQIEPSIVRLMIHDKQQFFIETLKIMFQLDSYETIYQTSLNIRVRTFYTRDYKWHLPKFP